MDIDLGGLPTLNREDLSEFQAPVFVSYGEHDIFFKARRAIRKAEKIFSESVATETVEGQGHMFTEEAERDLYDRVGTFLRNDAA